MNGPAPGWQPDPTGRHEYRYWDGTNWSDDVSDGGVTATDPVAGTPGTPGATQPFGATNQVPPTTPQPTYQAGYDPSGYDSGPGATGFGSGGYGGSGSGGFPGYGGPPAQPTSSGPSTGLLVGLAVLVLVLIGGIAFVLLGKDDGNDTATGDDTSTNPTTTGSDPNDPTTTAPDSSGSGDALVDAMAEGILQGSGGVLNEEEAQCMAQAMIDEVGVDRLVELGIEANDGTTDPLDSLTSEEQDAVYNAMLGCMDAGTLGDLPSG